MYPKLKINLNGIIENMQKIKTTCENAGIKPSFVTKLFSDNHEIVTAMIQNGADIISDSRLINFISYQDLNAEKWLIRSPSLSEVTDAIRYADVSLNSELTTVRALDEEAKRQNKIHKVILMYELGDLREGCLREELKELVKECLSLKHIELYGIGANLSCYGEILPTEKNMNELVATIKEIEEEFGITVKYISGGNSGCYKLLLEKSLPKEINNLRLGEVVYLGNIPCFEEKVPDLQHDNFILEAQIIELKEKPSIPWGECGKSNSFGEHHSFVDKGVRKRAIIGIGRQDIKIDGITPLDKDITLLDGSSDHIILDVTDSQKEYQVGDIVTFQPNYAGVLSAMTSKYIEKEIEK